MEIGRSDAENFLATELRLGLPGTESELGRPTRGCKRMMAAATEVREGSNLKAETTSDHRDGRSPDSPPTAKTQVVGWPPIRSYRKNNLQAKKVETESVGAGGLYVKVSMDGAPYLRKIDLKLYQSYENLREALEEMFKGFSLGNFLPADSCGGGSNYAVAYEDKDGDWMLAGDVPWRMFISSCKRLRIMRGSDAKGLSSNS